MTAATKEAATPAAKPGKPDTAPRVVKQPIRGKQGFLAMHKRNVFVVHVDDEHTLADFEQHPELWSVVSKGWAITDRVELVQSHTWSEGIVVDAGPGYAAIRVLHSLALPERRGGVQRGVPDGYAIRTGKPGEDPFVVYRTKNRHGVTLPEPEKLSLGEGRLTSFDDALRALLRAPFLA